MIFDLFLRFFTAMRTTLSALLSTTAGIMSHRLSYALGAVVQAFSSPSPMPLSHARRHRKLFSSSTWDTGNTHHIGSSLTPASMEQTVKTSANRTALVFDTETTGMVRFRDHYTDDSQPDLVQLGFLLIDTTNWKVRNQGSFLVKLRNDRVQIDEGAQRVHGISKEDCTCFGIEHETALGIFENLCRAADVIVAHNIRFDAMIMETAFHRGRRNNAVGKESTSSSSSTQSFSELFSSKRHICTMMASIDICKLPSRFSKSNNNENPGRPPSYKWPSLAEAFKFVTDGQEGELDNAHDALADSEACLRVFRYLVEHGHISMEPVVETEEADLTQSATSVAGDEHTRPDSLTSSFARMELTNSDSNHDERDNRDTGRNGNNDRSMEIEEMAASATLRSENSWNPTHDTNTVGANNHVSSRNGKESVNKSTGKGFRVRGNTYPHKEMIKKLGGRWDGVSKEWVFRDDENVSKLESYDDLEIVFAGIN